MFLNNYDWNRWKKNIPKIKCHCKNENPLLVTYCCARHLQVGSHQSIFEIHDNIPTRHYAINAVCQDASLLCHTPLSWLCDGYPQSDPTPVLAEFDNACGHTPADSPIHYSRTVTFRNVLHGANIRYHRRLGAPCNAQRDRYAISRSIKMAGVLVNKVWCDIPYSLCQSEFLLCPIFHTIGREGMLFARGKQAIEAKGEDKERTDPFR